jgi:hypothetical protein
LQDFPPLTQGNSTCFLCAKIPVKSNTFEEKNNHKGEEGAQRIRQASILLSFFAFAVKIFLPRFFHTLSFNPIKGQTLDNTEKNR